MSGASTLTAFLLVACGGALGAMGRYGLSLALPRFDAAAGFPWATFGANLAGCFLIGLASVLILGLTKASEPTRLLLVVGMLGGFTTFSSFALESVQLFQAERWQVAGLYVLSSAILCPLLGLAGLLLGRSLSA